MSKRRERMEKKHWGNKSGLILYFYSSRSRLEDKTQGGGGVILPMIAFQNTSASFSTWVLSCIFCAPFFSFLGHLRSVLSLLYLSRLRSFGASLSSLSFFCMINVFVPLTSKMIATSSSSAITITNGCWYGSLDMLPLPLQGQFRHSHERW